MVTQDDCGTGNGFATRALVEGGEVIERLRDRILGRVAAVDVLHPETQQPILDAGAMLDEEALDAIENAGVDEVKVRTPLTCETRFGICAKCYGRDLGRGGLVNVGEAVGVIAAQSIGEPGTQLTMRTFHIGGAAQRAAVANNVEAKSDGSVGFNTTMRYVTSAKGELVVIARSGEVIILDSHHRERERHKVPYWRRAQRQGRTRRSRPAPCWRRGIRAARPIVAGRGPARSLENVEEGVTVAKQVGEGTGLSTLVVIDPKSSRCDQGRAPAGRVLDAMAQEFQVPGTDHSVTIGFPVGSLIQIRDDKIYAPGEVLARIPVEGQKTRRHHRRPAAGGRAVRSAQPEGQGHAGRDHRHRVVRQGDQRQGAPADH